MDTLNDIFNEHGDKYRALMADLDGFDAAHQDDVIKILLTISEIFVDGAFGLGAVELAIKARDKLSSQAIIECDTLGSSTLHEVIDAVELKDSNYGQAKNLRDLIPEDYTP